MKQSERVAVITGAAGGIGYGLAEAFAAEGYAVVLGDRNEVGVSKAVSSLQEARHPGVCTGLAFDVTSEEELIAAVTQVMEQFGRIDVWVNNAGMQHIAALEHFPTEMYERLIRLMLTAPFIAMKHVFPIMKRQHFGRILNMASINGLVGFAGKAAYNSAKHGLIGLTKVGALEGAEHGITVNALCPGYVDTHLVRNQLADLAANRGVALEQVLEEVIYPLVPQKRLLQPEEIADYAVFLASRKASGVTGQAVVIDGGYTAQ
ncbi:MAG: 3-hydroxybutyrate dehydrogenase family protein [Paenibacillus sp.]|nr:3-hydroxybutyrate dehydrogenase family protein [Paenibacillus sp.]